MTLHLERPAPSRRPGAVAGTLLRLLLAVGLALALYLPAAQWTLEWRMVEYLLPWLLDPSTGFLSLTLALWLLVTMPGWLLRRSGARPAAARAAGADAGSTRTEPVREEFTGDRLQIPAVPFRELGAGHRRELADALGIPWRDELIHDHQSWAVAVLEAAHREAAASEAVRNRASEPSR